MNDRDPNPSDAGTQESRAREYLETVRLAIGQTYGARLADGTQVYGRILEADEDDGIRLQTSVGISQVDPQEIVIFKHLL